jgi:predicted polyphosphate/ATP-dependent NAD kinase
VADAIVGIVANPMSGRDVRRLVAQASVFPTAEKANMVQRLLTSLGSVGVGRVLLSTDLAGISASVLRAQARQPHQGAAWPELKFLDQIPLTETALDTTRAVQDMVESGVRVVICLGGDGTARVAAQACGDVPLLPLSTGTNNAFPEMREATVAGLAVGLVATGTLALDAAAHRKNVLRVRAGEREELALVDVAVSTARHVASRAVWDPATLTELYCVFAEPDGIGLSSVAGLLRPSPREQPEGVALHLGIAGTTPTTVHAPIAPGLIKAVGVRESRDLAVGETVAISTRSGVIAVDGEREIEFGEHSEPQVRLSADGPRCLDIRAVLRQAADQGLLTEPQESTTPRTPPQRLRERRGPGGAREAPPATPEGGTS